MAMEEAERGRTPLPVIDPREASTSVTTCDGCGVCCRELSVPPFLDEIDFIPPELQREVIEAQKIEEALLALGRPCLWLDETGKCRHYEDRPNVCREYETGGELCLETRARHGKG